jgi:hypothetical protein
MSSTILDIADAVVAELNTATFTAPFTAQRRLVPAFDLPELATLQVSVVPRSLTITTAARGDSWLDCAVDIGIQRQVADDQEAEALLVLVEEIAGHLSHRRLAQFPTAAWTATANEPVVAPEHLDQHRAFTSVLSITYRVRK